MLDSAIKNQQSEITLAPGAHRVRSDAPFAIGLCVLGSIYILLIAGMLLADLSFTTPYDFLAA